MNQNLFQSVPFKRLSRCLINAGYWFLILVYMETLMHALFFEGFGATYLFAIGFSAVIALLLSGLLCLLPRKANAITSLVLVCIISLVFCTQLVYEAVFGSMYSLSQVGMGGEALTSFFKETVATIFENLHFLALMLLPIPVTAVLMVKYKRLFAVKNSWFNAAFVAVALALQLVLMACLSIGGTGYYSTYYFYHSDESTTDQTAERFGLLTTIRLELFGGSGEGTTVDDPDDEGNLGFEILPVETKPKEDQPDATVPEGTGGAEETVPEETKNPYNTLEIDFDYLNTLTEDKALLQLNQYVSSLTGTKKNEYTGMLADYNLITICAESFATGAIQKELTPTLYKLATEGIVFNNYYNSYPNTTTDGEYSFCLGLWPDTTRGKNNSSFYASRNSYLPFALGNVFAEQADIKTYAYHNYKGSYYGRDETHPNMGYDCKFMGSGMTFTTAWPSSDLEMMEQSVDDYISADKQFHAYYMTFSGHYKYDTETNPMAKRNYAQVAKLNIKSGAAKCYLSCHLELEKALTYLMEKLEEAGIADKTAIVLAGDHFPYGLSYDSYSQLVGYEVNSFNKYKSTLIFWVGGLDEPIYVDDYMCNIDILPTILNLWGFSYDSRLMAGTDIFSDSEHIAVLRNQSILNDKVWFNANNGKVTWLVDESTVPEGYLDNLIKLVKNRFALSKNILNEAYYNFVFEQGNVTIKRDVWYTPAPKVCTCAIKCAEGAGNPECEVCVSDVTKCVGKEPEPTTEPTTEPTEPTTQPTDPPATKPTTPPATQPTNPPATTEPTQPDTTEPEQTQPDTTEPPTTTEPPVTTAPPETTEPPTTTAPPETTAPPVTTAPPAQQDPAPEDNSGDAQ